MILVLHAPTSPHTVIEFVKTATFVRSSEKIHVVVTRPGGLAAQSGVPEAWRHAHKSGVSMAVLSDLADAVEIYSPPEVCVFSRAREWIDFEELELSEGSMLVFPSGEQPMSREGLEKARFVGFSTFSRDLGPVASLSIALHIISKRMGRGSEPRDPVARSGGSLQI